MRRVRARSDRATPGSAGRSRQSADRRRHRCCRARSARCASTTGDPGRRGTTGRTGRSGPRPTASSTSSMSTQAWAPSLEGDGVMAAVPHRWRAHGLAVVTSVEPIAERLAVLERKRPGLLNEPGKAPIGVDDTWRHDRTRRAAVEAAPARPASVAQRRADVVLSGRDDTAEHEPAAGAGDQDVGVLTEPSDAGEVGDLTVDDGVVVGERRALDAPRHVAAGRPLGGLRAMARSGRSTRTSRPLPERRAGAAGDSAVRYGRAPTMTHRAPSTARPGSVDRSGLRYVNSMPA